MPTEAPLRTAHILNSVRVSMEYRINFQEEAEMPGLIPGFIVQQFRNSVQSGTFTESIPFLMFQDLHLLQISFPRWGTRALEFAKDAFENNPGYSNKEMLADLEGGI